MSWFKQRTSQTGQEGFVSLFTVIFFMLLITIITVGFLRIMAAEQRQSLDNDLTASAVAAAQSGVEDAKRAILKYTSLPGTDPLKNTLRTAMDSGDCDALFTNNAIRAALNLSSNGSVTGQAELNQYYTCLTVQLDTPDYIGQASAGKSEFIPLKSGTVPFEQIMVSWHLTSQAIGADGDGQPQRYAPGILLPPVTGGVSSWSSQGYPAYMRVELLGYPNGTFTRSNVEQLSRSVFLVPNTSTNATALSSATPIVLDTVDPRGADQNKTNLVGIRCNGTPPNVPLGTYACTARLQIPNGAPSPSHTYFLRVTPLYGASHFRLELRRSATNNVVNFREVQPIIDSTGRTSDVFRRLQTRVRLQNSADLPEYTIESADTICKNMQVADGTYYQPNNCP